MKYLIICILASVSAMRLNTRSQSLIENTWVELPDCSTPKAKGEIALNDNLSNVATANCKIRIPILDPNVKYCPDNYTKKKKAVNASANATNATNGSNRSNATNATNASNATNATAAAPEEPECIMKPVVP